MWSPDLKSDSFLALSIEDCVLIDYGAHFISLRAHAKQYFELAVNENEEDAARSLYAFMRMAENVPCAKAILLPIVHQKEDCLDNIVAAVSDRIFRAASGISCSIQCK